MATRQSALFHGRGCERGESDDIARSVDVRHGGLKILVHHELASWTGCESRCFQVDQVGIRLASYGVEQRIAVNALGNRSGMAQGLTWSGTRPFASFSTLATFSPRRKIAPCLRM